MAYQIPDSVLRSGIRTCNTRSKEASEVASLIHQVERDAYSSVLRAFKCQADDLSWEKQDLIIDLRKELRISNDEHKELLRACSTSETINNIRNWRRTRSYQSASCSSSQPVHGVLPSLTNLTPRKRPWTSNLPLPNLPSVKSVQYSSDGPAEDHHIRDRNLYSYLPSKAPAQAEALDPLIGRKAMIRWPLEEQFSEVIVTEYNPLEGIHKLVYVENSEIETYEWTDLNKIPLEDIQWIGEDPGTDLRVGHSVRGYQTVSGRDELPTQQNVIGNRVEHDLVLKNTDVLIREVEDIVAVNSPNSLELELAKKMLLEHEDDLVAAIALIEKLSVTPEREIDAGGN